MKTCPHCRKEIPESAIRCMFCRRPLAPKTVKRLKFRKIDLEPGYPAWSIAEVLVLWLFVFSASFALGHFEVAGGAIDFLKRRYFILTKEPALQFHLYVFTSTFILKISAIGIIWAILKFHRNRFVRDLKLDIPFKKEWAWMLFAFFVFSAAIRLISDIDPLSPNLPIYLFFKESSVIGNIITLVSLVIIAPFSEEIFFRGFMYPGLNKKLGLQWAVLITSLLFMAVHIPQCKDHLFILFSIFIGGIFLTLARAVTKSTLAAILLHAVYNGTIVLVGFLKFLAMGY
ncbi:MAG: CPBP family intramembrane metalloprotease [Candidatus Omnitrophica bacterium]|nr:CPBP family intramembrane metalloprotease [Candidatus Omnitrophota bacterium]